MTVQALSWRVWVVMWATMGVGHASTQELLQEQDDKRIQDLRTMPTWTHQLPSVTIPNQSKINENDLDKQVIVAGDELDLYPELVTRALSSALLYHQADDVAFLLPYYERLPESLHEASVWAWAKGVLAEQNASYSKAIEYYQVAMESYPDIALLRLRLAVVFFANKQWKQSKAQFDWLTTQNLPTSLERMIHQYLAVIDKQGRWQAAGNMNFLQDKNINNAPKNKDLGGGWVAPDAQSAKGFGYATDIQKKWLLDGGVYVHTHLNVQGKHYYNNKRYNELTTRLNVGAGYQNANFDLAVLPFIERNYYAIANQHGGLDYFSKNHGLAVQLGYQITPKWQVNVYGERAKQTYQDRKHLDGSTWQIAMTQTYLAKERRYWYTGLDYQDTQVRDADDSFTKKGVRAGLGWSGQSGLSARFGVNYAKKVYKGAGFFGQVQQNDEYGISASVWHSSIQLAGIMPRLTWQYQKVDSNLPLYRYDKNHIFLELGKQF